MEYSIHPYTRLVMGFLFLFKFNFILSARGLPFAVGRLSLVAACRLLTAVASLAVEDRLQGLPAQALWFPGPRAGPR